MRPRRTLLPLAAVAVAFLACAESGEAPARETAGATPLTRPNLSGQASGLEMRMTRAEVLGELGPATWAVVAGDSGSYALTDNDALRLFWQNAPGCAPVMALFDADTTLSGWDEGRTCLDGVDPYDPGPGRACTLPGRRSLCQL